MANNTKYLEFRNWFAEAPSDILDASTHAIGNKNRRRLIENIIDAIQEHYVYHAAAAAIRDQFENHALGGAYDNITDGLALGGNNIRPSIAQRRQALPMHSLPRDIAMIEIRGFVLVHWEGVRENIDGKMSSVANAYALIIDLRENRGGDLETVALIASYLMGDDATVWLAKKNPSDGLTQNIYTTPVATEKRLSLEKPIFILTSSQTISGGEDIAYGLQVRERAKVVGEKTAGAANLPRACALNDNFVLFVPHMQAISPVTRSSWEGVGVVPDVEVSTELAFYTAQRLAREKTEVSV